MKSLLNKVWPELLMVAIMAVLALAFMSPVMEGKTLFQNDIVQAKHMAREVDQFQKSTGEYSGWTNSAFGGMPAYQIKSAPSRNIFQWLFHAFKLFLPGYTVAILFVTMLGFYFLLRTLKLDKWLALAGAVAVGFGSHHLQLIGAGHVSKIYAIAYMAPVIAGVLLVFKRKYLLGGLITAVGFGIQLVTNHVQVSYYTGMILVVYFLVELVYAIREKYLDHLIKSGVTLLAAVMLAVLPNMTNLLTTYEYSQESTRGKSELVKEGNNTKGLDLDYITAWSYGIGETFNLFIPNLYGGGSGTNIGTNSNFYQALQSRQVQNARSYVESAPTYWGGQPFTSGPHYLGAITIFLAILGLIIVKGKKRWWLAIVILLSLMLGWGKNFMGLTAFFVNNVPLYSKFRDATNSLIIAQVAIPLLAFLAVREWFTSEEDIKLRLKKLYIASGIAGGIALLFALMPSLAGSFTSAADAQYPDWVQEALRLDRIALARKDSLRTLIFVLLGAGILWYSLKAKFKKEYLFAALALLMVADMWTVGKRYLRNDEFTSKRQYEEALKPRPVDQTISQDKSLSYRVYDLTADPFRSARASGYHMSLGGYHGAKLGRYQDLIDTYLVPEAQELAKAVQDKGTLEAVNEVMAGMNVLNMLNTKCVILQDQAPPLPNSNAMGNAWFVDRIKWVGNANDELKALAGTQLTNEAVADQRFQNLTAGLPAQLSPNSQPDAIQLVEYKPNYLKYSTQTSENRVAVFSEIYYPHGWKAMVDGKETPYFRANYALRAMVVPAGQHSIEFRFDPQSLKTGQLISLIGTILVLLAMAGYFYLWQKGKKAKSQK
jgi:hypothetical protein